MTPSSNSPLPAAQHRHLETHLALALEAAGANLWEYDHRQDRLLIDAEICLRIDPENGTAPQTLADWLARVHPEDRDSYQDAVNALNEGKTRHFAVTFRLILNNGSEIWLDQRVSVIESDSEGRPVVSAGLLIDITEKRRDAETQHRQDRTVRMLSGIAHALNRHQEEQSMLEEICMLALEVGEYCQTWIGLARHDEGRRVDIVARSGVDHQYLDSTTISWGDNEFGRGPTGRAIRHGLPVVCRDTNTNAEFAPWREKARRFNYRSSIALPLRVENEIIGAFNLYSNTVDAFNEAEIAMLEDLAGEIGFCISILRSRQALARSQDHLFQLSQAVEQSPHSIVITDTEARIEYVNSAFVENTGYTRHEVFGQAPNLLDSGETPEGTYTAMRSALSQGRVWRGEFMNRRKNGSTYSEFAIISPLRQSDGTVTHYLAIMEDISEKKRTAAELERHRHHLEALVRERSSELIEAKEQAETANRAKSAFLANMSHEIRTPLNAIVGLAHLVQRDLAEPQQLDRLGKINDAAQHLLTLINDVLDISKIEAGKLELEETEFSVRQVFDTVHGLIVERAREKSLPISLSIDPAVPPVLSGDPLRVQQILLNFLSNALKFTERGEIAVAAMLERKDANTVTLRFSVRDTGICMSTEVQSRLFSAFEQADSSTTRRYGGTGLGLAISQRLAEAMQGEIGVISEPNRGSTFWFTATLAYAEHSHAAHFAAAQPHRPDPHVRSELQLSALHAGQRILIAEDNLINQEVAGDLLRDVGLEVDIASNGAEATVLMSRHHYDLILMDMQMPVVDGLEATRLIRAMPQGAQIPIVAMTANAFEEDRRRCFAAGMNDHIGKPVDPETLFSTLLRWLPTPAKVETPPTNFPVTPPQPALETCMDNEEKLRDTLKAIPGLDAEFGLKSVRDRLSSYLRLLGKFAESHNGDFALILAKLNEGQIEEARRLAHSMKGAAGSLGAVATQTAAAHLELAIKEGRPLAEVTPLIETLQARYGELQQNLRPCLAETSPESEGTAMRLRPLVTRLHQLLQQGDMSVQALVREQQTTLSSLFGADLKTFDTLIADFDFEGALVMLEQKQACLPNGVA